MYFRIDECKKLINWLYLNEIVWVFFIGERIIIVINELLFLFYRMI